MKAEYRARKYNNTAIHKRRAATARVAECVVKTVRMASRTAIGGIVLVGPIIVVAVYQIAGHMAISDQPMCSPLAMQLPSSGYSASSMPQNGDVAVAYLVIVLTAFIVWLLTVPHCSVGMVIASVAISVLIWTTVCFSVLSGFRVWTATAEPTVIERDLTKRADAFYEYAAASEVYGFFEPDVASVIASYIVTVQSGP